MDRVGILGNFKFDGHDCSWVTEYDCRAVRDTGNHAWKSCCSQSARAQLGWSASCTLNWYRSKRKAHVSQNAEDLRLLPTLMSVMNIQPHKTPTFVELGALDGVTISNSLRLEHCFRWHGLLIEANPNNFGQLLNHSGRRVSLRHSAVCATRGHVNFSVQAGPTAGEIGVMTRQHTETWKINTDRTVRVPCQSLASLMVEAALTQRIDGVERPTADFLSLDVEGAEAKVLETIDPAAFRVMMIESKYQSTEVAPTSSTDARVHELATRAGMRLAPELYVPGSRVYLRHDVAALPLNHSWLVAGRFGRQGRTGPAAFLTAMMLADALNASTAPDATLARRRAK